MAEKKVRENETPTLNSCENCLNKLRDKVPARFILYFLSMTGLMVNFIIRDDINITILAMVKDSGKETIYNTENYCYAVDNSSNATESVVNYSGTFDWSPAAQNYIIASYYWMHVCAHLLGGVLTQRYGSKRVLGFAQLSSALCSFFIPMASETHYAIVVILRCIQGFTSGFVWPTLYSLVAYWIPPQERGRFLSSFQGSTFGTGLSYALCAFIIPNFNWKIVFYTSGGLGLVWCTMWYFLAFDSPENHPRISHKEKYYIKQNTNTCYASRRERKVPWLLILRSRTVWAIAITNIGRVWIIYTFTLYGPQYMKHILGFSVKKNGFVSGGPFLTCFISVVMFGYIADGIMNRRLLTMGVIRKLFTFIGLVLPSICCVLMGYVGCNTTIIIVLYFLAINLMSACFAGVMSSVVDIAPNFSGIVIGLCLTVYTFGTVLLPLLVGYITRDGHTISAYRIIFIVAAGVGISTYLIFHIWGSSEIQNWNSGKKENSKEKEVMLEECVKKISIQNQTAEDSD